ncbi:polysaccharide biosynthesis/export family protein [Flectobacillus sp. BAB-3569]|uniref:polysaccharide biosynthesis/export family protein n=1 Tax=Flectobacillus sp. BAB-3569 TaxID=1509483 RepID=UPI000BA33FCB|nr:polysaccharide biosynthesis/export family protein [Flectobacillus sp. BAB-3569]PAC30615.1 ligand-binding protein [Flectobacillus sp. BAB-3569]
MKISNQFLWVVVLLLLGGCSTVKQTVYFQGDTAQNVQLAKIKPQVLQILPNDILGITVVSLDDESNKLFEMPLALGLRYSSFAGSQLGAQGMQPLGYLVDSLGFIEMPLIGRIQLEGLTLSQASIKVKESLEPYLKKPSVNVRILNHKFTILGEVGKPSIYNLLDDNTTLLDALGQAGDLTIYGRRDNIMLIRDSNGTREYIRLNLLDKNILNSKYFYLKNGDVIYVEPSQVKSTFNDRNYQLVPIATGIISAVTALGVLMLNLSK